MFALTPTVASAQGAWLTLEDLGTPRSRLAAATAPCPGGGAGHKGERSCVYAIGGTVDGTNGVSTVQAYDPATNTWLTVASLTTPRRDLAAATAPCPGSRGEHHGTGGQGDIGGQNNGGGQGNNNASGNTGDHRDDRDATCVYAIGGSTNGTTPLDTVEAYNPATNTWSSVTRLNTARTDLAGTAAPCPRNAPGLKGICVYAIGGTGGNGAVLGSVEVYSPEKNRWVTLDQGLPTPRSGLAAATALCPAVVVGRKEACVYAVGGGTTDDQRRRVEVFLPVAGVWATLPSLPTARDGLAAAGAPCPREKAVSCVYAIGGNVPGTTTALGTTETYDPAGNVWATLPPLPTPRTQLAATGAPCPDDLRRHCVYAIGGERAATTLRTPAITRLATVEAFDIDQ
ncbi:kelch repeat-containing protein [Streptomyces sp. NPDC005820]|uniref:Kelch repeat-containing protein n=1 Tax=Streptomyces sp. NPDC005820 TaxID=3157069 RepID=UPI0033D73036